MGVLLLGANSYGTLAAARSFGARGIHVTMADESRTARALFSRYVKKRLTCPPAADTPRLLEWLKRVGGESRDRLMLYPTNDHQAWLLAEERAALADLFFIYHPDATTNFSLLDKCRLYQACERANIAVPETRFGQSDDEILSWAGELRYPVLLKPRTQIFLNNGIKGRVVADAASLPRGLAEFRRFARFNRTVEERYPEVKRPLVQAYLPVAETQIFSVSGFRSREGGIVLRGAMKVLQRPRKLGIGLCFEGREVEPELAASVERLCVETGYYGAFESEFIVQGKERLLIDFNPRFFSQMAFDGARGLDLPMLVYHGARGESAQVEALLRVASAWRSNGHEAYCHRGMLNLMLRLQGVSGQMSNADVRKWRAWVQERGSAVTDAVSFPGDPAPRFVDALQWLWQFARQPRSFVQQFVLNR